MRLQAAAPTRVRRILDSAGQQRARRNALVASTALAARRAEQREVDAFLADLAREPRPVPSAHPA
jgi:hypothetical protein